MTKSEEKQMELIDLIIYNWRESLDGQRPDQESISACECFFSSDAVLDEYRKRVEDYCLGLKE